VKIVLHSRIFVRDAQSVADDQGIVLENGIITDVGKYQEVIMRTVEARVIELDGIICPPLINAHTHLELSPFKAVPHLDFVDWVSHLVAARYSRIDDDLSAECLRAKCDAEKSGTAYFVNVGNDFELNRKLGKNQLLQFEQIGINDAAAESIFGRAVSRIAAKNSISTALAIHAPYSTSPSLMRKIKDFNNSNGAITSVHLAETADEVEFVKSGRGRMVDLLNERLGAGKWSFHGTGLSPVEYLDSIGILDERTLCVHCVFVSEKDLEILKKRGCGVVVCVRSNRNLSGSVPEVSKFLKHGIRVLLGTDSKASSPDLDIFAEMSAFYNEFHSVCTPQHVFRMATIDAADVLGVSNLYGSIAPGKAASFVYTPFAGKIEDAFEFLVTEGKGKTEAVVY
jgi:cytosine/adenosine deaminase-related metal-dependent hydrolase